MQIRICTENDVANLIDVSTKSYLEHYTYLWHDEGEYYIKSNFNYDKLSEEISNPNSVFFLLLDKQDPIGVIKLNVDSATAGFTADLALELERIYFVKEAAGKGFGKEAIAFVMNYAMERNKKIIWLKAMESSPAVEFYKKRGFTITSETTLNYPGIRAEFQKMFVMQRIL